MATQEELDAAELEAARDRVDKQAAIVAAIVLSAVTQGATQGGSSSQLMMVWPESLKKAVASLSKLTALAAVVALLPRKGRGSGSSTVEKSTTVPTAVPTVPTAPTRDQLLESIQPEVDKMIRKIVDQDIVQPARQRQLREMGGKDAPQTADEAKHWAGLIGRTAATRAASEVAIAMAEPVQNLLETKLVKVWLSRGDSRVRQLHRKLHSKTAQMNEPFWQEIGTGRELRYPGDPKAPIEQTANCRCHLFLARADEAAAASDVFHLDESEFALVASGEHALYEPALTDLRASRAAAMFASSPPPAPQFEGVVVVLIPDGLDDIEYNDGDSAPAHSTLAYLGKTDTITPDQIEEVRSLTEHLAQMSGGPFTATVAGKATLGEKQDEVVLIESVMIQALRDVLEADGTCDHLLHNGDMHPHFIPHITYPHDKAPDEIQFSKIGLWVGDEKVEHDLTG